MANKKPINETLEDIRSQLDINSERLEQIQRGIIESTQNNGNECKDLQLPDREQKAYDAQYLLDHSCILRLFKDTKSNFKQYKILNIFLLGALLFWPFITIILSSVSFGSFNFVSFLCYIYPIIAIIWQIVDIARLKGAGSTFDLSQRLPFKTQKDGFRYSYDSTRFKTKVWLAFVFLYLGHAFDLVGATGQYEEIVLNGYSYAIIVFIIISVINLVAFKLLCRRTLDSYNIAFVFGKFDIYGKHTYGYFIDPTTQDIIFSEDTYLSESIYFKDFKKDFDEALENFERLRSKYNQ